jgi:hypothetical protein
LLAWRGRAVMSKIISEWLESFEEIYVALLDCLARGGVTFE